MQENTLQPDLDQIKTSFKTIRDWLRFYVTEMLKAEIHFGHGCDNALDESVYLIQASLNLPVNDISPFLDAKLLPYEHDKLFEVLKRRILQREPAAYIVGEAWLAGYNFKVDPRVIIPRSFIAELLQDTLSPWVEDEQAPLQILDLCSGSGCLGILSAIVFPNAQVDCIDISAQALEVAKLNIKKYNLQDRVQLIESDLFDRVPTNHWDVILTNPPYVNSHSMAKLPAEYLHEPNLALAGGDDGLNLIHRILNQAHLHLSDSGLIICELGHEKHFFESNYPNLPVLWLEVSAGQDQVFMIRKEDLPINR